MKILKKIKLEVKKLKNEIVAIYYAYKNPLTPILPKIIILLTLGYALSPIDLIPDFIPVLGYLDDLIILPLLIRLSIKLIPDEIMIASREKAKLHPLGLKKRWVFGVLFVMIWVGLLVFVLKQYL